jgi:hypothetical protein
MVILSVLDPLAIAEVGSVEIAGFTIASMVSAEGLEPSTP